MKILFHLLWERAETRMIVMNASLFVILDIAYSFPFPLLDVCLWRRLNDIQFDIVYSHTVDMSSSKARSFELLAGLNNLGKLRK